MLPFCGYNMADYFSHWLTIGATAPDREVLPKIFYVNWFRKDADGKWLWPGYGENSRVLEWVFNRVAGKAEAEDTPIGYLPAQGAIDITGLDVTEADMAELLRVDVDEWKAEVPLIREHYAQFGDRLPAALSHAVDELEGKANTERGDSCATQLTGSAFSWPDVWWCPGRAGRAGPVTQYDKPPRLGGDRHRLRCPGAGGSARSPG